MQRLHLTVHGRVQGVAFRAHAMRQARSQGLNGWVRNVSDGTVEVLAEGQSAPLANLARWCQDGPPSASVARIEEEWLDYVGDLGPFGIRYS